MQFEFAFEGESAAAAIAGEEARQLGMHRGVMLLQMTQLAEGRDLAAAIPAAAAAATRLFADVRLFARVEATVNFEGVGLLEAPAADGAMEGRFAGMHAHVTSEIGALEESFPALFARVLRKARVHAHVSA